MRFMALPPSYTYNVLLGLPRQYSDALMAKAVPVQLKDGDILFSKGDPGEGCYWLEQGTLKVTIASPTGEQRILAVLGPGAIVGELAMIDGLPRSATVEAMHPCRLAFVSRSAFLAVLKQHPDITQYLLSTVVQRLRQADDEAAAASFLTVNARVARALLHLAKHLGEPTEKKNEIAVRHNLRQSDLAALAGVARESASRTLSEWRRRNVIVSSSRGAYLINVRKLESEAERLDEGLSVRNGDTSP